MARRHTRLSLPPVVRFPEARGPDKDHAGISATMQRLRGLGERLVGQQRAMARHPHAGPKAKAPCFDQTLGATLQGTQLPILGRKASVPDCSKIFRKELKRNQECTPLSTITVRWLPSKEMPEILHRWVILQDLCKYGPIDSVIFTGEKCSQVVFSSILSACKAISSHSVRHPKYPFYCFWYYPFMMQNYRF